MWLDDRDNCINNVKKQSKSCSDFWSLVSTLAILSGGTVRNKFKLFAVFLCIEFKVLFIVRMGGEELFTLKREELTSRVLRLIINERVKQVNIWMLYRKFRFPNKTLKQTQTPPILLIYFYFRTGMKGPICFVSYFPKAVLIHGPKFRSYL